MIYLVFFFMDYILSYGILVLPWLGDAKLFQILVHCNIIAVLKWACCGLNGYVSFMTYRSVAIMLLTNIYFFTL